MVAADLDDTVRRLDPERWLATRFIADPVARADVVALYAFDHELARAARVASNPLIAEIRLVWWREAVEEIWGDRAPRAHPVAQALADAHRRHGLPRAPFEAMIDARIDGLEGPVPDDSQRLAWAEATGGSAAVAAAAILDPGAAPRAALPGGRLWGLVMLARETAADPTVAARQVAVELPTARRAARELSALAFPSVAHATLARGALGPGRDSDVVKRLRILWAVASGRL